MQTETTVELLDQMQAAILTADFQRLNELTPALETCVARAMASKDARLLKQISARAERNAALLLAAGRGVRAAQRRLSELRAAKDGFSTYDGQGKRAQHGRPTSMAHRF